jgi:hypothetical protein
MPIKFRCQHCKQFLGIAHSKAGSLVDCPTCGRTLRVPNADGSIDPPPALGMNLADNDLRRALDELGQIGQEVPQPQIVEASAVKSVPARTDSVGLPRFESDPVEINPEAKQGTATHVRELESKPSPPNHRDSGTDGAVQRDTVDEPHVQPAVIDSAPPLPNSRVQSIALEPLPSMVAIDPPQKTRGSQMVPAPGKVLAEPSPEEILAGLVQQTPGIPSRPSGLVESRSPIDFRGVSRIAVVGIAVACFLAGTVIGFGVGRWNATTPRVAPIPLSVSADGPSEEQAVQDDQVPRFKGELAYLNRQGRAEPDSGARILAIPNSGPNTAKLPSIGFRPADDQASRVAAHAALVELGGAEATADAQGRYKLQLPASGSFQLIVLSRFQGRKADSPWSKAAETTLRKLFDRPEQLVGSLAFHVETVTHEGEGAVIWDYVSERE